MAQLTMLEKRQIERALAMGSGYVLNFSNKTMAEFVTDAVNRDLYGGAYEQRGASKANHLRAFFEVEDSRTVGRLLNALVDYALQECNIPEDDKDLAGCRTIAARLLRESPVPELDALAATTDERDFEIVARAVRESIDRNEPAAGIDRLHTFVIKFVRRLCQGAGLTVARDKPLHSLFGEYVKSLRTAGRIESGMTERILKSSISTLEAFNDVRNNQSLAHDNAILGHEEALLIFNHVSASVRFLRYLERTAPPAPAPKDEDIPF